MKKISVILLMIILSVPLFALSNEELRSIMEKKQASIGDAIALVNEVSEVKLQDNAVIKKMNSNKQLTIGDMGKVMIEAGLVKGGILYKITHFGRYASHSLKYNKIVLSEYSWNRKVSGVELIEFFASTQPSVEVEE